MAKSQTPLTFKRIEASKPGDELSDPTCPGLRFIHDKNGLRYWQYRYRNTAGVLRRMTLGHFPALKITEARDEWNEQKRIRRKGLDPLDVRQDELRENRQKTEARRARAAVDSYTVGRLLDEYLEHQESRIKTWRKERHHLNKEIRPKLGALPVSEVTKERCREILDPIEKAGHIHRRNRTLDHARACWNWALRNDKPGVVANPWASLERLREAPKERYLSNAELRRFLTWLPGAPIQKDAGDALLLTLLTGCRPGEIAAAPGAAVDPDERTLRLEETKNGRPHTVYLSRQAWELVKPRRSGDWLFPSPIKGKKHIRIDTLSESLRRALTTSAPEGLAAFTPHDLRRSMATWLGEHEDCPPGVIERMLNHHTSSVTTRHYNLAKLNKPAKDWWQRWGDHLSSLSQDNVVVELRA